MTANGDVYKCFTNVVKSSPRTHPLLTIIGLIQPYFFFTWDTLKTD